MVRSGEDGRVRITLSGQGDPDHGYSHGTHGTVVAILEDDTPTDDDREEAIWRVELDTGETGAVRRRGFRPPFEYGLMAEYGAPIDSSRFGV